MYRWHGSRLKPRRSASVYSAENEYKHCWEGTCDRLVSRTGGSVSLYSKYHGNLYRAKRIYVIIEIAILIWRWKQTGSNSSIQVHLRKLKSHRLRSVFRCWSWHPRTAHFFALHFVNIKIDASLIIRQLKTGVTCVCFQRRREHHNANYVAYMQSARLLALPHKHSRHPKADWWL